MVFGFWFFLFEELFVLFCVKIILECFIEFIFLSFFGNVLFYKFLDLYRNCVLGGLVDELDFCFLDLDVFDEGLVNFFGFKSVKVKFFWFWK